LAGNFWQQKWTWNNTKGCKQKSKNKWVYSHGAPGNPPKYRNSGIRDLLSPFVQKNGPAKPLRGSSWDFIGDSSKGRSMLFPSQVRFSERGQILNLPKLL
jgi:hypothetical protein